jgi:hypothetical protein
VGGWAGGRVGGGVGGMGWGWGCEWGGGGRVRNISCGATLPVTATVRKHSDKMPNLRRERGIGSTKIGCRVSGRRGGGVIWCPAASSFLLT